MTLPLLQSLPELHAALWAELTRATHDKHHAWRTPVLATADAQGADARTVVLREAEAAARTLHVFSDARAAKVTQLLAQPQATMVLWSPKLSWQLRLRVQVDVHLDGLAVTSRWARLQHSPAAQDYLAPQAPGAPVPSAASSHAGEQRHHFAVLSARVLAMDWLELRREGHRRAAFDDHGARWLTP